MGDRYKTETGGDGWVAWQDNYALAQVIPCLDRAALLGACDRVAETLNRGHRKPEHGPLNGDLVWRHLWGMAIGAYKYEGYRETRIVKRPEKYEDKLTWAEEELIRHAATSKSKERGKAVTPTAAYLATMRMRPVPMVQAAWDRLGPAMGRGAGFGVLGKGTGELRIIVGDRVRYDGAWYTVEKDYGNGVYLIGNLNDFVDMVPASQLTK
jgi:hypothetical protein